ncbi:MAG: hypothetical protein K2F85_02815 [Helicobacter sp.]|nr:hypothetical protein [Helicobacter sp.]
MESLLPHYESFLYGLRKANNKLDLDMMLVDFAKSEALAAIYTDTSETKREIAQTLREKLYTLVLADGDVFEQDYVALYVFFTNIELPPDERFAPFVQLASDQLGEAQDYLASAESIVLIELATCSLFLQGKTFEALKFYIHHMSVVHLSDAVYMQRCTFSLKLLTKLNISFDSVYPIFEELFDVEHILSLSPIARRSVFVWTLHQWWNVPSFFNHLSWAKLYPLWREIFYRVLESDFEFAVYLQFFVYHFMGNSFHTQEQWKGFMDDFCKKAEPYYVAFGKTQPPCKKEQSKGKKLIGFLRDRIVQNSPGKVEYSLLKALQQSPEIRQKYEFKIYLMGFVEKSSNDEEFVRDIQELGVEVVDVVSAINNDSAIKMAYYASHLRRALAVRNKIIDDGVDILISTNNGYGISDLILCARSAPLQIFYSHGNGVYDLAAIDKRISHFQPEGGLFAFEQIIVPMDIDRFYNPPVTQEALFAEGSRYPKDKLVLGVIGRLVKVDCEEYLATIADVMHQNPETIFIAAGMGNTHSVREKVRKLGIPDERFYMPGHVDPHLYGHLIDIFCNTFPLVQGESLSEFAHKGRAFISLDMQHRYEQYLAADFGEELHALKLSQTVLLYIRNVEDCKAGLMNWNEILGVPESVLLCTPAQHEILAPLVPKGCKLLVVEKGEEDMKLLADMTLNVTDGSLCAVQGKRLRLVPKHVCPFLAFFNDPQYEDYRQHFKFLAEHPENFEDEQKRLLFDYMVAFTVEDYKCHLTMLIQDEALRNKAGRANVMCLERIHKERQRLCIESFMRICQ